MIDEKQIEEMFQQAMKAGHAGELERAETLFEDLLEFEPGSPEEGTPDSNRLFSDVHNNLATLLAGRQEYRDAIGHFRNALDFAPGHTEAMTNLGQVFEAEGNLEGAIDIYRQAIDVEPGLAVTQASLGRALKNSGRVEDAIDAYNKAISLDASIAGFCGGLGEALEQAGRLDEAETQYRLVLGVLPDLTDALLGLNRLLCGSDRTGEAIEMLEEAAKVAPGSPKLFRGLQFACDEAGLGDESAKARERADKLEAALVSEPGSANGSSSSIN